MKDCEVGSCSVECGIGEATCERSCSMATWGDAECPEGKVFIRGWSGPFFVHFDFDPY